MSYYITSVRPDNKKTMAAVQRLLEKEGIRLDANLDYTCCAYDDEDRLAATGSCFGNTLRCFAVDSAYQGEGLLNQVAGHLIKMQAERGNSHLFLYTKCQSAKFFNSLGFHEIARVENKLVFMENRKNGFSSYLHGLEGAAVTLPRVAAVVMNANPFTLGHQYLVEKAAAENDLVHLFVVSEDMSLFPFHVRMDLVRSGTAHLANVVCHESGPYIISSATFPSYFLKDEESVVEGHARLDLAVFQHIAQTLHITSRYVGEEHASRTTEIYNEIMAEELPKMGLECVVVPRRQHGGEPVSASTVRRCIQTGDWARLDALVPAGTLEYLHSPSAEKVIEDIRRSKDVIHC